MPKYKYNLTFRVNMDDDGYAVSFHRKRDCTTREAKYILMGIFGFYMPQYQDMLGHDHMISRYNTELIADVHDYLDGKSSVDFLYQKYAAEHCENSFTDFDMFVLAEYLQERGII